MVFGPLAGQYLGDMGADVIKLDPPEGDYPRLLCSVCYCKAVTWLTASGREPVHSWTVAHHAFHPTLVADLPCTLVTVDLQECVRALGRWRGAQAPTIGMPVAGAFETRSDGVDLVFQATPS